MRSVTNTLPMPRPDLATHGRHQPAGRRAPWAPRATLPCLLALLGAAGGTAHADDEATAAVPAGAEIAHWMRQAAQTVLDSQAVAADTVAETPPAAAARIEVSVGRLDPRLKLAPCQKVVPYLPTGSRALGNTRIGLRCAQGPKPWNVYLPVTVKVFTRALVAATAVPAGTVLQRQHLTEAEVDVAASTDPAIRQPALAVGRTLARNLGAGDTLHQADLKQRLWFAAGDTVRVVAMGPGYQIAADAQALGPGVDGQTVRARIEGGRIVSGVATADRRIEVPM